MVATWVVVGLGNPGPEYVATRHNVGQAVVDRLADGARFKAHRSQALVCETHLGSGAVGHRVVLAKPTTFMNVSGGPVAGLVRYFAVDLDHVVVVHDDLDIGFGSVRLKQGGGEGGHNGLRSVTKSLGDPGYLRVRVGIGRPPGRTDAADFVLRRFSTVEQPELALLIVEAADAVTTLISDGLGAAQQLFHART